MRVLKCGFICENLYLNFLLQYFSYEQSVLVIEVSLEGNVQFVTLKLFYFS